MSDPDNNPAITRERVRIQTNDPASMSAYAATSTLPGAGRGLFAGRLIGPYSPLDDGKYIGEYAGGEHMTEVDFNKCMLDPDPKRQTGHVIMSSKTTGITRVAR